MPVACAACSHVHGDERCPWNGDHEISARSLPCLSEGGDFAMPVPFGATTRTCRHRCECPRWFKSHVYVCAPCGDEPPTDKDVAWDYLVCDKHEEDDE